MFVRFEITRGLDAESPMNPPAIRKAKIARGFILRYFILANKIGVSMSAAPSLAKNAATRAPRRRIYTNILFPLPPESFAIFMAAHSKKPISSRTIESMMIPMNANVASQTMSITVITSLRLTTPTMSAAIAPMTAVVPICKPFGCQITKMRVIRKRVGLKTLVDDL